MQQKTKKKPIVINQLCEDNSAQLGGVCVCLKMTGIYSWTVSSFVWALAINYLRMKNNSSHVLGLFDGCPNVE